MRRILALLICLLAAGCNLPTENYPDKPFLAASTAETKTPYSLLEPAPSVKTPDTETIGRCAFVWASKALPALSDEVQRALLQNNVENVSVRAEAFGEDCRDENGELVYFVAMETDYSFKIKVSSLDDAAELGDLVERIIETLSAFPDSNTPGANPGFIEIEFYTDANRLLIRSQRVTIEQALTAGIRGAELYRALRGK